MCVSFPAALLRQCHAGEKSAGQRGLKSLPPGSWIPSRLDEIAAYKSWAQEILDLEKEKELLLTSLVKTQNPEQIDRLMTVGERLGFLGDSQSVSEINHFLENVDFQEHDAFIMFRGIEMHVADAGI